METATLNTNDLFTTLEEAVTELVGFISPLNEQQVNGVPYENSWTAGQLMRHVSKSIGGLAKAITIPSKPAERDPGEKIAGFKATFLDFSTKMKSPDMVAPEDGPYQKQEAIEELQSGFEQLKLNAGQANLNELVEGLPMGPVTKLELLHFVLYHTQRHVHQMKKIFEALHKENTNSTAV